MTRSAFFSFLLAVGTSCLLDLPARQAQAAEVVAPFDTSTSAPDADAEAWDRFKIAAAKSSDLRVRIAMSTPGLQESGGTRHLAPDPSVEALVEQARGSTDPIVLWLLTTRCSQVGADGLQRCDRVAMAERWTVADTQNMLAWVALADALASNGRHDEAREAMRRGAQASTWREDQTMLGQVLAAAVSREGMTPHQRAWVLEGARMIGSASSVPLRMLRETCKDTTMRATCLRYLDTMARDADNLMALRLVAVYSARVGAPDDVVMARNRKSDAYMYAVVTMSRENDDADVDAALRRAQDRVARNEATRAASYLADAHLTVDEASRRFSATLTAQQRRNRSDAMRPWSAPDGAPVPNGS